MSRLGDDVCFDWRTSRRHGELTSLIEGDGGVLQSDGYEATLPLLSAVNEAPDRALTLHSRFLVLLGNARMPELTMGQHPHFNLRLN